MTPATNRLLSVFRWTARISSISCLGLLLLFFLGEGFPLRGASAQSLALAACFPVGVIIGTVIGWWRDLLGGIVAIGSLVGFYVLGRLFSSSFPHGFAFLAFAFPGFLFLLSGLLALRARRG